MCIAAIHIFLVRQVFFVAAEQVKNRCKNVEREISVCFKKTGNAILLKANGLLITDACFKQ